MRKSTMRNRQRLEEYNNAINHSMQAGLVMGFAGGLIVALVLVCL